ncbi:MAG: hypothetical protein ACMVP2_11735 [Imperialibacter sp.]|uniref:hypothetical protein n=1 Tax=Imperialibacter sp. TaxID=2038411 RepID=UPI003A838CA7
MRRLLTYAVVLVALTLTFCSEGDKTQKALQGKWKANWTTSKEAFPDVGDDIALTMEGWIEFNADEVTITAYGYPGCIFSADTLKHSQKWALRNDTLELLNEGDKHGIAYLMKEKSDDHIQLVLMGDIFLDLTR